MADIDSNLPVKDQADGTDGSAAPSTVQQVGGIDGSGNLQAMSVDTAGRPNVNINGTVPVSGTIAATQSGSWTVAGTGSFTVAQATGTNLHVVVDSAPTTAVTQSGTWNLNNISGTVSLPTGASTSANQTNGSQKSQIVNSSGTSVDAKALNVQVVSTDVGLVTNSVLHGLTTAGGGSYVDVKVNPSGALTVDATQSTSPWVVSGTITANAGTNLNTSALATSANLTSGTQKTQIVDGSGNVIGSVSNELQVRNVLNGGGSQGSLTVGTSAVLANVSGSNLSNRKNLVIYNNSLVNMFWGYTSGVTTSSGILLAPTQMISLDVGPSTNVYVIAGSSSNNARVAECA